MDFLCNFVTFKHYIDVQNKQSLANSDQMHYISFCGLCSPLLFGGVVRTLAKEYRRGSKELGHNAFGPKGWCDGTHIAATKIVETPFYISSAVVVVIRREWAKSPPETGRRETLGPLTKKPCGQMAKLGANGRTFEMCVMSRARIYMC